MNKISLMAYLLLGILAIIICILIQSHIFVFLKDCISIIYACFAFLRDCLSMFRFNRISDKKDQVNDIESTRVNSDSELMEHPQRNWFCNKYVVSVLTIAVVAGVVLKLVEYMVTNHVISSSGCYQGLRTCGIQTMSTYAIIIIFVILIIILVFKKDTHRDK